MCGAPCDVCAVCITEGGKHIRGEIRERRIKGGRKRKTMGGKVQGKRLSIALTST